ncbi:MAG: hypothetical protein Q8Q76_00250 [Methylotenera sp.]|nr:hypothetical protein [Methylotenera sp.]
MSVIKAVIHEKHQNHEKIQKTVMWWNKAMDELIYCGFICELYPIGPMLGLTYFFCDFGVFRRVANIIKYVEQFRVNLCQKVLKPY